MLIPVTLIAATAAYYYYYGRKEEKITTPSEDTIRKENEKDAVVEHTTPKMKGYTRSQVDSVLNPGIYRPVMDIRSGTELMHLNISNRLYYG